MNTKATTLRWLENVVVTAVTFDAVGLSYYGDGQGSFADFGPTLDDAASRYGKPVLVPGTAHPFRPAARTP